MAKSIDPYACLKYSGNTMCGWEVFVFAFTKEKNTSKKTRKFLCIKIHWLYKTLANELWRMIVTTGMFSSDFCLLQINSVCIYVEDA